MKSLRYLLALFIAMFALAACSEDDDDNSPNTNTPTAPEMATVADSVFTIPTDLSGFTSTDVTYNEATVTGYVLPQFFGSMSAYVGLDDSLDARKLFAVHELASDGWSPRNQGSPDLSWDQFKYGYFLPSAEEGVAPGRTYFPDENVIKRYDVKMAGTFELYRKVDVVLNGVTTLFEVGAFAVDTLSYTKSGQTYHVNVFPATNLISTYVTSSPANYAYHLTTADNYEGNEANNYNTYTYEQLQKAYYVISGDKRERIVFLDDANNQLSAVQFVQSIELVAPNAR